MEKVFVVFNDDSCMECGGGIDLVNIVASEKEAEEFAIRYGCDFSEVLIGEVRSFDRDKSYRNELEKEKQKQKEREAEKRRESPLTKEKRPRKRLYL